MDKVKAAQIEKFAYDSLLLAWGNGTGKIKKEAVQKYHSNYIEYPARRDSVVYILEMMVKHFNSKKHENIN